MLSLSRNRPLSSFRPANRLVTCIALLSLIPTGCGKAADEIVSGTLPEKPQVLLDRAEIDSLVGYWVRVDDTYAGTIVEISGRGNEMTGTLIHVSDGLVPYGFQTGDIKLKDFRQSKTGELTIESLVHNVNQFTGRVNEWYDHGIARVSKDELLWRQTQYEDREGGEWQRWIRTDETSEHGGNLLRGLGNLSVQRDKWTEAMEYFRRAVDRDRTPANLNSYAWFLAVARDRKHRDAAKSIKLATECCKATNFKAPVYLDTLAAAYAADEKWNDAIRYQLQACRLLNTEEEEYFMRLAYYQERTPFVHGMYREVSIQNVLSSIGNTAVGNDDDE